MPLSPGDKLGTYEILAPLGAGGMGEVYRARDGKLDRDVAVKVLSASLAQDADYMARFQREAKVLASLNHPNIAQIFGLEQNAIVMEFVEGSAPRGPLPADEVLKIARQIADALEAAHEKGVVHRDLKPANIKVTPAGVVKVLDFGLAKAAESAAAPTNEDSPTLTMRATQVGVILGTASYMAPEQAAGKRVDRRADIWSFGVVLWELLTGKRLFDGETLSHTLADVLRKPIDLDALPQDVPPALRTLVRQCLERDLRKRLQWIGDGRIAIEEALADPHIERKPAAPPRASGAAWIAAAIFAALAATVSLLHFCETPPTLPPVRATILPPVNTTFDFANGTGLPAVSPDGKRIVFGAKAADGKTQLWVRPLDAMTAQPLAGTDSAWFPFWSPDSRFIAFFADRKLKKIDASGGPPITLTDAPRARGGTWAASGVILFASDFAIRSVSAAGGASTPVPGARGHLPSFLPDGRHFLFDDDWPDPQRASDRRITISVGSLDGKEPPKKLLETDTDAIYAQGYLLFVRAGTLMAQPFDAKRLVAEGEAMPVAEGVEAVMNTRRAGVFSVSQTGILVMHTGQSEGFMVLTWFDRAGRRLATAGEPSPFGLFLRISPDQKSVIAGNWIYDLSRGVKTGFSTTGYYPLWSPDGRNVAHIRLNKDRYDIYRTSADGSGTEELLYSDEFGKFPEDWSPDGNFLLYSRLRELWALPLKPDQPGTPLKPFPVVQTPNASAGRFSPDGRWIAYHSTESGRYEIYVVPFPPVAGHKQQISTAGGAQPRWRRDGKELFFEGPDQRLMAAEIQVNAGRLSIGAIRPLFVNPAGVTGTGTGRVYDVSADGQRFLIPVPVEDKPDEPLTLIQNWAAGLKK